MISNQLLRVLTLCLSVSSNYTAAASGHLDEDIGGPAAEAVMMQMGLYPKDDLDAYVQQVGQRLVAAVADDRFTFRFAVVDDPVPNAFALPGGYVYVTRGILALLQSEDELAGVMAHEIIHVTRRHGVKRNRRGLLGGLLEVPGRIVGGLVDERVGQLINSPITGANSLVLASYGRGQEREADKRAVKMLAAAGYDPSQLGTILQRLAMTVELVTGRQEQRSLLRDHPVTDDRLEYLNRESARIAGNSRRPNRAALQAAQEGMVLGLNPDRGIMKENRFLHPGLGFAIDLPSGWQSFNYPVAVGATATDERAALFLTLEASPGKPAELGQLFVDNLPQEYRAQLHRAESTNINGIPAYVVTLLDSPSRNQNIYLHMAWAEFQDYTLRLAAYGTEEYQTALRISGRSLRRVSDAERNRVSIAQLRIVASEPGESIDGFSERVGNEWTTELTKLINDVSNDSLTGQKLKTRQSTRY